MELPRSSKLVKLGRRNEERRKMSTFRCFRTGLMLQNAVIACREVIFKQAVRNAKRPRFTAPYLKELYMRRIKAGPEPERHPSAFGCWNYDAEIYAFGKRFGEEFDEEILKRAFVMRSYIEREEARRKDLGVDLDNVPFTMEDNEELARQGEKIASRFIKAFLRHSYPLMFEEGICAIHDYLMSHEMLYYISSNLGFKDIIMSVDYPPTESEYCLAFKAVIGALSLSKGTQKAELFVRDIVLPQLIGKDINEIWEVVNPMGLLTSLLAAVGRGPPEPRLLWQSGSQTVMSVFHVGIYSDKELIGRSPGESVTIAEEMAAREALKNLMQTSENRPALRLGHYAENIKLDYNKENLSVEKLTQTLEEEQIQRLSDGAS